MEFSNLMKLRVAAALIIGGLVLGYFGINLVRPDFPVETVTNLDGQIGLTGILFCAVLAFISGFIAYFPAYPYGIAIGPLAGASGTAVIAIYSGKMSSLFRLFDSADQRLAIYQALKMEGFIWLAIAAAGLAGALAASKILPPKKEKLLETDKFNINKDRVVKNILAVVVSIVIAHFLLGFFAQDVKMFDSELGSVTGQPEKAQIAFASAVAFGAAAFVVKLYLDASYIFPAIATAFVCILINYLSARQDVLSHMAASWPVYLYARTWSAILPVELVSFGTLGAAAGYWMAIQFDHWRKHS